MRRRGKSRNPAALALGHGHGREHGEVAVDELLGAAAHVLLQVLGEQRRPRERVDGQPFQQLVLLAHGGRPLGAAVLGVAAAPVPSDAVLLPELVAAVAAVAVLLILGVSVRLRLRAPPAVCRRTFG